MVKFKLSVKWIIAILAILIAVLYIYVKLHVDSVICDPVHTPPEICDPVHTPPA